MYSILQVILRMLLHRKLNNGTKVSNPNLVPNMEVTSNLILDDPNLDRYVNHMVAF